MTIKIAPSILSADFARLGEELQEVATAGADWLHIDVMDGHFVPNITIGPCVISSIRKETKLPFDVHLMIESPETYLKAFRDAGSDMISVHAEACRDLKRTLNEITSLGATPGVAINPETDIGAVSDVLDEIGIATIMSVNPGFGGQSFIPDAIHKVSALKKEIDGRKVLIEVDGGINQENARLLRKAGADVLVAGSFIFKSQDKAEAITSLRGKQNE